jgi:hypothetical protein
LLSNTQFRSTTEISNDRKLNLFQKEMNVVGSSIG